MYVKYKPSKHTIYLTTLNTPNVISSIKGSVRRLGEQYTSAVVILYNKSSLQPIAIRKPDQSGNYQFLGLDINLKTFIVAFDKKQQFNAVIQDNVVPK
ncbi:hypothetical protein [Acinetobacter pecorum]|uniref:Transposase n=1 Tax=Acinetobacter pecorum TaxID=2762215 RepID=A0ABR8VVF0_9GAMM|nr:hypothetical protein [Acinetobacter pecorum]MBD8008750.1 hypothetical protein [Acinetobacter pecorum]